MSNNYIFKWLCSRIVVLLNDKRGERGICPPLAATSPAAAAGALAEKKKNIPSSSKLGRSGQQKTRSACAERVFSCLR